MIVGIFIIWFGIVFVYQTSFCLICVLFWSVCSISSYEFIGFKLSERTHWSSSFHISRDHVTVKFLFQNMRSIDVFIAVVHWSPHKHLCHLYFLIAWVVSVITLGHFLEVQSFGLIIVAILLAVHVLDSYFLNHRVYLGCLFNVLVHLVMEVFGE